MSGPHDRHLRQQHLAHRYKLQLERQHERDRQKLEGEILAELVMDAIHARALRDDEERS